MCINVYERTYRTALAAGWYSKIVDDNRVSIEDRWVLINNVDDRAHAASLADALVASGEISGYRFVADAIDDALAVTGLTHQALRTYPYFLDYGLVMGITGSRPHVLGWDAETFLEQPADWLTPALGLLAKDPSVFSAAPRWPVRGRDSLPAETVRSRGPWAFNYGFSDQVFLVRRSDLASPIYRDIVPAAYARHANHPRTFEARLEAHQRAQHRFRATHTSIVYATNDLDAVIPRQLGGYSVRERTRIKVLNALRRGLEKVGSSKPELRLP
jgi:hypothetical protein